MKKILSITKAQNFPNSNERTKSENSNINSDLTVANNHDDRQREIEELQKKIEELRQNIKSLEQASEIRERAIGSLARDKERLASDLRKERRGNINLRQQLEDERNFYYKEKETFCQEMNEYKRSKRKLMLSQNKRAESKKFLDSLKEENEKLKETLEETMQTNYNLCIKFLRIKNTKDDLRRRFQRYQNNQAKILDEITTELENTRNDLHNVISEQFEKPLSLSHKKFLEVTKRNSQLVHENLCLKSQLEEAINVIEQLNSMRLKSESKQKLPFLVRKYNKVHKQDIEIVQKNTDSTIKTESNTNSSKITSNSGNSSKNIQLFENSVSSVSDIMKVHSCPAIVESDAFKQIKSTATQTSLKEQKMILNK